MSMRRRDALKYLGAGAMAIGALRGFPSYVFAATPDLAVIKGADPAKNVKAAVDALGGIGRFVAKGDKVVVKPNLGFGNAPIHATTTDPAVVRAVCELALSAGAKRVTVLDNPCHKPEIVLDVSGVKAALAGLDDTFTYTVQKDEVFRKVELPHAKALKKSEVALDLLEADALIAVPVAKSHGAAKVSFTMKGWMGVVQNRRAWHVWYDLHQAVADMAAFIKPKLIVLDATRALVTNGPGGPGKVEPLQTIVAGTDQVSVDAFAVTMAPWGGSGYKVEDIPYIVKAAEMGVGNMRLDQLTIHRAGA